MIQEDKTNLLGQIEAKEKEIKSLYKINSENSTINEEIDKID